MSKIRKTHQGADHQISHETKKDEARSFRFQYLMEQTEIFGHFMANIMNEAKPKVGAIIDQNGTDTVSNHMRRGIEKPSALTFQFEATPEYIKHGQMRDYQLRGLNWLISLYENDINGILADEMGLGKTLQTISLLGYLKHYKQETNPHIIVVPKTTLGNWMAEINKWCPSLKAIQLTGNKLERRKFIREVFLKMNWDVCVTTYEMCLQERFVLRKVNWCYIVIDEAHRIKNINATLSNIIREFKSSYRLLLTGTPLQNNLQELWSLLNFLLPDVFNSADDFNAWFDTNKCLGDDTISDRLRAVLKPFLLRRLKSDVERDLKPKIEVKLLVGLTQMQSEWYSKILAKEIYSVNGIGLSKQVLQNILMQLRKCTNHPYLFDGAEPGPPYTTGDHLIRNSGKMIILNKMLPKFQKQGSRVLIFCQMTKMLDILEDYCIWRKYDYSRLDGKTSHEDRKSQIEEYNAEGSNKFIFMLSTRAGGLGINLVAADIVIIYDSDWNPQVDLQAMARAHRIGQKKQVRVFRFITQNTVEEKIIERAELKLRLDQTIIQQKKSDVTKNDLLDIIQFGADQIMTSTNIDDDFEEVLKRSEALSAQAKLNRSTLLEFQMKVDINKNVPSIRQRDGVSKLNQPLVDSSDVNRTSIRTRRTARMTDENMPPKIHGGLPRPPNYPNIEDFQFYPPALKKLLEQETYFYCKTRKYQVPVTTHRGSVQRSQQSKINAAKPLTKKQEEEKQAMLQEGFASWKRYHFDQFIDAIKTYGSSNMVAISKMVRGKTAEEIRSYSKVFWKRYHEIEGIEELIPSLKDKKSVRHVSA